MEISTVNVKDLVEKGIAILTDPPKRLPTDTMTDAPLLGNGDLGAAIGGDGAEQVFYLGKNDFWTQAHLAQTDKQRQQRLLEKEGRRSGTRIVPAGWLKIEVPALQGCSYHTEQNPYYAEVLSVYQKGDMGVRYTSFISAEKNILAVEMENIGKDPLHIIFSSMPGIFGTSEIYGYSDGIRDDTLWWEYPAEPYSLKGSRWLFASIATDIMTQYHPEYISDKGGEFWLLPDKKVHMIMAVLSDLDAADAREQACQLCISSIVQYAEIWEEHRTWWKSYWEKSFVQTGDDILDAYYYSSLYFIGSAVRSGKVQPGLYGPWITSDRPKWTGSYTINYNYESPYFCLYTANRTELAESYVDPLLEIIPIGQLYAKNKFDRPGICLPVEIGPWGTVCCSLFHHQKINAAYCCCNIFMHYYMTLDETIARKAYPFVWEVVQFWEADLVWEHGCYNIVGDCLYEEYSCNEEEKNNVLALGALRMLFRGILDLSEALSLHEEKKEKWEHILNHLAPFPTFIHKGEEVFRFSENGIPWIDRDTAVCLRQIYPFNCIGLDSPPELLRIALNTVCHRNNHFDDFNSFCEYTVMCARVGRDPQLLYDKLIEQCLLRSFPNRFIWHGGGGMEDCSGVTSGINEMMLQSHEGVVRIFPVWPRDKDASFYRLRAYGAFLVSAMLEQNYVKVIRVESEKGMELTIALPWEHTSMKINGNSAAVIDERRAVIPTKQGDVIEFEERICLHTGQ